MDYVSHYTTYLFKPTLPHPHIKRRIHISGGGVKALGLYFKLPFCTLALVVSKDGYMWVVYHWKYMLDKLLEKGTS